MSEINVYTYRPSVVVVVAVDTWLGLVLNAVKRAHSVHQDH